MAENAKKLNFINETVAGSQGCVFAEINDRRYVLASLSKFKATFKTNVSKGGVLGLSGKQNKPAGWEGEWEATFYYNQSTFRELAQQYAENGIFPTFNIQVINEDPMSVAKIGRQSITFIDCIAEEITMAMIDVDADSLDEDVSGTFNDFKINDKFKDFPNA